MKYAERRDRYNISIKSLVHEGTSKRMQALD
jgi:hypothetical protein